MLLLLKFIGLFDFFLLVVVIDLFFMEKVKLFIVFIFVFIVFEDGFGIVFMLSDVLVLIV